MITIIVGKLPFYSVWKAKGSVFWKRRRYNIIMDSVSLPRGRTPRILEVGCANGMDFIRFACEDGFEIWGVDIEEQDLSFENVHFVRADAADLPFDDGYFDLVVSIGLLEHIEPMEKLCAVIREFDRVGKHQVSVMPSILTPVEPHSFSLAFPLRIHRRLFGEQKGEKLHLNLFTDHTWTKFSGFFGCHVRRFFYIPPFISNTMIYK